MDIYVLCSSSFNNILDVPNTVKYDNINSKTPFLFLCENKYNYGIVIDKNTDIKTLTKKININKMTDKNLLIRLGYDYLLNKYESNNIINITYNKNKVKTIIDKLMDTIMISVMW